jgi:hypothetical protein
MRTMQMACTLAGVVLSGVVSGVALAQAPMGPPPVSGPAGEVQQSYAAQKDNLLKTRRLCRQICTSTNRLLRSGHLRVVNHVTEAQVRGCGAVKGTPLARHVLRNGKPFV